MDRRDPIAAVTPFPASHKTLLLRSRTGKSYEISSARSTVPIRTNSHIYIKNRHI